MKHQALGLPAGIGRHRPALLSRGIETNDHTWIERVPAWIRLAWQDHNTNLFNGVMWHPPPQERYSFKHERRAVQSEDLDLEVGEMLETLRRCVGNVTEMYEGWNWSCQTQYV